MFVSEARIEANRRNSKLSTGPKSSEGKTRSRANALTHGLCATVCVPEDVDAMQIRAVEVYTALKPQNEYHAYMVDRAAIYSLRIERCERMERRVRDKAALRAELTWDDDRRLEAEIVGAMLASRPAETVETLRRTPHGCEWLMTRWAMLAHAAGKNEGWTAEQTSMAFDLLATPKAFRDQGKPGTAIDFEGNVVESDNDPAAVARRMVAELKARREVVAALDEVERTLVETDHDHDSDPELRRLRRYESTLHSRFRWFVSQINSTSPHKHSWPGMYPRWKDPEIPSPKPEPKTEAEKAAENYSPKNLHPPFDLEPDEYPPPGQRPDIPAILKSRKQKRLAQAESRREARRRKLDKLRA